MPATESTTMTPSMNAMLASLSPDRGASVTELSKQAELGRSTGARVLTALEDRGLARRERPNRSADHNSPDLWFTAATGHTDEPDASSDESALHTPATEPDTDSCAIAKQAAHEDPQATASSETENETESAHDGEDAVEPTPQLHEETGPDNASEGETAAVQPETESGTDPAPAPDDVATDPAHEAQAQSTTADASASDAHAAPESGGGTGARVRLGKGELRVMVFEHLKAHPDEDFTASQVGKALNKSSGAVANNFDALAKTGDAQLTCEKPRKFRFLAKAAN